jgi:hypothetical protein
MKKAQSVVTSVAASLRFSLFVPHRDPRWRRLNLKPASEWMRARTHQKLF